jgi:hypothetical protein
MSTNNQTDTTQNTITLCKNCQYWNRNSQECNIAEWVDTKYKVTDVEGLTYYAKAYDDSGLQAGIRTAGTFGCNRAKPKTKRTKTTQPQ